MYAIRSYYIGIDGQRLEFDAELGKVLFRLAAGGRAQMPLQQLTHPALLV